MNDIKPEPGALAEAGDEPPVGRTDACKSSVPLGVHSALLSSAKLQSSSVCHSGVKRNRFYAPNKGIQVYVSAPSALYAHTV